MRVVSGAWGRSVVHFEAPPSDALPEQMSRFLAWLEPARDASSEDAFVRAGLAHLRLVTLHPFDDGNGRVTRALTDLVLARADVTPTRLWSLSAQIEQERAQYYAALQSAQRGAGDVTDWLVWFLGCVARALCADACAAALQGTPTPSLLPEHLRTDLRTDLPTAVAA